MRQRDSNQPAHPRSLIRIRCETITKTRLYNFDSLKPHLKLNWCLQGYTIFLILLKNIDCGYSLEPPRRGGCNEYPQSMLRAEIIKKKNIWIFYLKNFLLVVQFSIYLNRRVFVMLPPWLSKICTVKMVIRLCEFADWSESSLGAHARTLFSGAVALFLFRDFCSG